jgi:hypothetical protein
MEAVKGSWYRCASTSTGHHPLSTSAWPEFAQGMLLDSGRWQLLEIGEEGWFVLATERDIDDQVTGSFEATTFDAFYADAMRQMGPVPMPFLPARGPSEMTGVLVLAVPPSPPSVRAPLEPVVSVSPRTLTLGGQRFLALGELDARLAAALAAHATAAPNRPHCWALPTPPPEGVPYCSPRVGPDPSSLMAKLERRCAEPRKERIEPKSPSELLRHVQGRWYHCRRTRSRPMFPTFPWPDYARGMELVRTRWFLLEAARGGKFVRARARPAGEVVRGTFRAITLGAFKRHGAGNIPLPVPVPPAAGSARDQTPVLTVPQPKNGFIYPVKPVLSASPRTLTINNERFVLMD